MRRSTLKTLFIGTFLFLLVLAGPSRLFARGQEIMRAKTVFNIRDFGATGNKSDNALPAIQKAIAAATTAGGGMVYFPPGDYTSGTIDLHSHVNLYLESGATLYASEKAADFDHQKAQSKDALFFGENLEDISIDGRGTIDGQQKYIWQNDDSETMAYRHKYLVHTLGKSEMRTYPAGHPDRSVYPHLLWLGHCKNVRITGVSFLHSPSWTFALYDCTRVVIDSIYVYTSLKEAVWADGIDIVGCDDVSISNSTIETGDDCIIFVSDIPEWGPVKPCQHITVTNCRLSSASAAIKFSEGNSLVIRDIVITNCVIFNSNRGLTLQIATGGDISNVVISNITMDLRRFDWFWAGDGNAFNFEIKRQCEWNQVPCKAGDTGPGSIHNVIIRDIIIHSQGSSTIYGHPESWLSGLTFENIKFFMSSNPDSPYDIADNALAFRYVRDLKLRNIEINWEKPFYDKWQSALSISDADGVQVDGFSGNAAWPERNIPALDLSRVTNATLRNMDAPQGTNVFLKIAGADTHDVHLIGNDFHQAKVPYQLDSDVKPDAVTAVDNFTGSK
jgi:hypothetical protein